MTETRDQDRTRQIGADMREQGMPAGQAPARQQRDSPMTAVQRAAHERQQRFTAFIDAATANQVVIERSLKHHGITFDFFMAALEVGLRNTLKNDPTFFEKVSPQSFLEAVLKATHLGLLPDGKEGAVVRYAEEAAFLPMVEGFVKILWATGACVEINHNVVCEGDDFDFQEGDSGYVTHRRSLKRAADAEVIGAWCVIKLTTGGTLIEICDQADLKKIAAVSRAQKGPRVDWAREMHRKGPFRRIVKRMPKTAELARLIAQDDSGYDLTHTAAVGHEDRPGTIPLAALAASRAHVRKQQVPESEAGGAADAEIIREAEAETEATAPDESGLIAAVTLILHAPDLAALVECEAAAAEKAETDEEKAWVLESVARRRVELMGAGAFALKAVISSATGLKEYVDPDLWRDDILAKLAAVSGDAMKKFWAVNLPHILDAGENGYEDQAEHVLDVGREKGLPAEMPS